MMLQRIYLCIVLAAFVHSGVLAQATKDLTGKLNFPVYPLKSGADLDPMMDAIGDRNIVLLGEASHGTSEYYQWRTVITKRLVQELGFRLIAFEGEFLDFVLFNQLIKGPPADTAMVINVMRQFQRWPVWMWGNYETVELMIWLNQYNQGKKEDQKITLVGLDLYNVYEAINGLYPFADIDSKILPQLNAVNKCFQPYGRQSLHYGNSYFKNAMDCRPATEALATKLNQAFNDDRLPKDDAFVAEQYARVIVNGERYFKLVRTNESASWNISDRHMHATIKRLLQYRGH
jgi:erythromycin esterase-like protein